MLRRLSCLFLLLWVPALGANRPEPTEVTVIVTLEGEPVAANPPSGVRPAATVLPLPDRRRQIADQQAALEQEVIRLGGVVTDRFDTLLNAIVVRISRDQLPALHRLAGVLSVRLEKHFSRALETSVPWTGTPAAWSLTTGPWTGAGMRIAIIDSGIDYLHASLGGSGDPGEYVANDPTVIEPGSFPTARVIGGTDFVGDNYDSSGIYGSPTARPDPDPLDTVANGHGTHVAAIAAGNGVLTDETPYAGPYTSALDFREFSIAPGIAPEAQLYAYKVFGSAGSTASTIIIRALERCLDPDQDGSSADRVEVANLSLGSPFGVMDGRDPEAEAVNRLANQGVIVVISAGNSGNTFYVAGSPGIANRAITVANSLDDGASFSTIKVEAPAAVAGDYASTEGAFTPPLVALGPVTALVVQTDPPLACEELSNAAALEGKIALIDRGACFFVDKIRRAQNAGAVGVIVVNNVDGPPIEMGGSGDTSDIRIPGVMISQIDGVILKGQLGNGLTVTLDAFAAVSRPELADQISESSSRGPSVGDQRLKPDLTAPGTSIFSAKSGSGSAGVAQTGTSMSAPHVAGAAALMRQARPTWSVEDIKAALMNTSEPMFSGSRMLYPESRIGAGRLQVDAALRTMTLARAETGQGDVSVSFGAHELSAPLSLSRNVRVVNQGAVPVTFQVRVSQTLTNPGVSVVPLASSITVPGRSSAQVGFRLDLDPTRLATEQDGTSGEVIGDKFRYFLNETSGQLWFTNATQRLHVPWHVMARPTAAFAATARTIGVPDADVAAVPLPTRGASFHPVPLVSAFQLGFFDPSAGSETSELVAVGATSDYARTGDLDRTRLYFGLATGGKWSSPQYPFVSLEVEIDTDWDGGPDYVLLNGSGGNLNGQSMAPDLANDALLTLVSKVSDFGDDFVSSSPLNVLIPRFRDTAAFHNRVLIHSVDASVLELSAGNTRLRYQVMINDYLSGWQSGSGWIEFDVAAPVIDPTPYGLQHSPLFDEGSSPRVNVDRQAAAAAGFNGAKPLQALLLHQHGSAEGQVEVMTLDLTTADTDHDGLPDVWELEYLGDLADNGLGDPDRDGRNNAAEWAEGTHPLDTRLLSPTETGVLRWLGVASRTYTLERAARLDGEFQPILRRIPGAEGTNSLTDPQLAESDQTWFYRLRTE